MLLIFMTTVYTIGSEMKTNTQKEWMGMAGNSITVALTANCPQTLVFFVMAPSIMFICPVSRTIPVIAVYPRVVCRLY